MDRQCEDAAMIVAICPDEDAGQAIALWGSDQLVTRFSPTESERTGHKPLQSITRFYQKFLDRRIQVDGVAYLLMVSTKSEDVYFLLDKATYLKAEATYSDFIFATFEDGDYKVRSRNEPTPD